MRYGSARLYLCGKRAVGGPSVQAGWGWSCDETSSFRGAWLVFLECRKSVCSPLQLSVEETTLVLRAAGTRPGPCGRRWKSRISNYKPLRVTNKNPRVFSPDLTAQLGRPSCGWVYIRLESTRNRHFCEDKSTWTGSVDPGSMASYHFIFREE